MVPLELGTLFLSLDLVQELQSFGRRLVSGLVVGSIYALAGVGLTLVYGILRLANFAHGDFLTLGAYLALYFVALITLPATQTWGLAAASFLVLLVIADRWLRPLAGRLLGSRWSRRALSDAETGALLYAAAAVLALVLGSATAWTFPVAWTWFLVALVAAAAFTWAVLASTAGAGWSRLAPWTALGVVAALGAHFLVALQTPGGLSVPGELAVGLAVVAAGALRLQPEAVREPWVMAALGGAGIAALFLLASPILLAVTLALVAVATLSVVLDLIMWRPARRKGGGLVTLLIMAIGLALVLRNVIIIFWGGGLQGFPGVVRRGQEILGTGILITPNQAIVIGITLLVVFLLHFFLQYTKVGKAMRALSDNMDLARVSGIDVDRVILYVWIIGGALVALAGILFGMTRSFTPNLGWHQLLPIFAAVILGGIGSAYGALAGGFVIGIAMETSVYFGVPPEYRLAVGFGILILVMIVRPSGIFGRAALR
jgi:neutral amino acid transport system permease protein